MAKAKLTLEDYIATLRNSSLPTVVTEGRDDYSYFRRMEEALKHHGVSLLPVGGRPMVLQIFERRKDLRRNNVAFIVDQDLWVFEGVPQEYTHRKVILSDGYSIENDFFRDGDLEAFLQGVERDRFRSDVHVVAEWYSFCVSSMLSQKEAPISEHVNHILDDGKLSSTFMSQSGFTGKDDTIYYQTIGDYQRLLRGKTLLELLVRQLSETSRPVKFGYKQLMEIAATRNGAHYRRVTGALDSLFSGLVGAGPAAASS